MPQTSTPSTPSKPSVLDLIAIRNELTDLHFAHGGDYTSLTLDLRIHTKVPGVAVDFDASWKCYTPNTGHTAGHPTAQAAMDDTRIASTDAGKLIANAEALEAEARRLRARVIPTLRPTTP
jgi:hypothetical protein